MPSDPKIRASDQDRDRTAALLREHHAAGRLTLDEFNERLDKVYAAKTVGELDALMADLPAIDLYQLPDASLRRGPGGDPRLPWWRPPGALMATHGGFPPGWPARRGGGGPAASLGAPAGRADGHSRRVLAGLASSLGWLALDRFHLLRHLAPERREPDESLVPVGGRAVGVVDARALDHWRTRPRPRGPRHRGRRRAGFRPSPWPGPGRRPAR